MVGGDKRTEGSGSWNLNLLSVSKRILWRMSIEPRILVYEGRRFLRPETGPKVVGAKETGFENLPRLIISCVLTVAFMIGGGVWYSNKLRSGEIAWDSPMKWLVLVFTVGPMFFFISVVMLGARKRKPSLKPQLPPNPVRLSWGFQADRGRSRMTGSLEIEHGLIRVRGETQLVEINRREVDQIKIVEGRVRLRVPKFHSLPAMHLFLNPINEEPGNLADHRKALKELVHKLETMPSSILPSTYPTIERREFERPPGTLTKCMLAGIVAGLALMATVTAIRPTGSTEMVDDLFGWIFVPASVAILVTTLAFADVWVAKSENNWLRKKGIVRD